MGNTLTSLAADLYKAADVVGREIVGFVSSCLVNSDGSERVAKGDSIRSHFTRAVSASSDITEAMTIPEGTDQTVDTKTLSISKAKQIQIPWTGEDIKHVDNGSGFRTIYGDQIAQAMRTLANEIEADLATEAYQNASRAFGTAGTTPFGSNFSDVAEVRQMLVDNGCPINDGLVALILSTAAGTNLRQLATLTGVNTAGTDATLRRGELLNLQNISLKESAQVQAHTKGTGTGYLASQAEAIDQTTLTLDTGSGTMIKGDVITHASDSVNKYVVFTTLAANAGTPATYDVVIANPGLKIAAANNDAITIGNNYTANVALHKTALELAIRPPAVPEGGDAAVDAMTIQDPLSGLVFEIRAYKGYRKAMFEVAVAYGYKAWKPEHIMILLG